MAESDAKRRVAGKPGPLLRQLRAAKGWTLVEVGARTGLPVSTLSKLENGKMGLSYDKLLKLGHGLGVDVAELISEDVVLRPSAPVRISGRRAITRRGDERMMDTPLYEYALHSAELLHKSMHPMILEVKVRSIEEYGELSRHEGEEFTWVIEGAVTFHSDLYEPAVLNEGDSVFFDAGMGHAYIAASPGRCRILSVSTNIPNA